MLILVLFGTLALIEGAELNEVPQNGAVGDHQQKKGQGSRYNPFGEIKDDFCKDICSRRDHKSLSKGQLSSCSCIDHENSSGVKEDNILDLNNATCRLFEDPTSKEVFDSLKTKLRPILLISLKELTQMEQKTYEVATEVAGSIYLLELLSSWNPTFETAGKKAGRGVMQFQEGARLVAEGQKLLQSAIIDMSAFMAATCTATAT